MELTGCRVAFPHPKSFIPSAALLFHFSGRKIHCLSFLNEVESEHEAHIPGQLEYGPDVTQTPSLDPSHHHIC
jgi:hypothetical protein